MFRQSGTIGRLTATERNNINIPPAVLSLLERLRQGGFEACLVGGCVRDLLRGEKPSDYDAATSALPEQVKQLFNGKRVIETGLQHGTVTVLADEYAVEITTYRIEAGYSDHRHPDAVIYTSSLTEDLARRDFTVNAIAYLPDGSIVDPFGGREDIEKGILRCVGEPEKRFSEDALRILRAVRFSAALGFEVEKSTAQAAHRAAATLCSVSKERLAEELSRLICGAFAGKALLEFSEVISVVVPRLRLSEKSNVIAAAIAELEPDLPLRMALLLSDISPKEADEALRSLRYSNAVREATVKLLTAHLQPVPQKREQVCIMLDRLTPELFFKYIALERALAAAYCNNEALKAIEAAETAAHRIIANNECYSLRQLAVSGNDLTAAGISPGRKIGEALNKLLEAVISGSIANEKNALLEYLPKLQLHEALK